VLARGLLDKAIDAYLKGLEADWRDAYTGLHIDAWWRKCKGFTPRAEQLPVCLLG
jgi:hypothetical protein